MALSPFGGASVTEEHPYLGAQMVAPSFSEPSPLAWEPALLGALARGAWKRAEAKLSLRAGVLTSLGGSPSQRTVQWNAYAVPLTLCPSQTAPPEAVVTASLMAALRRAFPRS
eukprot:1379739-Alexandrium_andersonii.AAC.1